LDRLLTVWPGLPLSVREFKYGIGSHPERYRKHQGICYRKREILIEVS